MKKLMFTAVVALGASVLMAVEGENSHGITSSKIVGFLNREGRESRNFYTPCFEKVDGSEISIQDVQLEGVDDMGADLQILDANRKCIGTAYAWLTPAMAGTDGFDFGLGEGMGAWIDDDYSAPNVELQFGQVVQVTLPEGAKFKSCGQVCDDDAVIHGRKDRNFVGNPYPAAMSIQNIQCDDSVEDVGADLQILDANRKCIGTAYAWVTADTAKGFGFDLPEGNGAWINDDYMLPAIDPLQSGEGVQITLPANHDILLICPIEL